MIIGRERNKGADILLITHLLAGYLDYLLEEDYSNAQKADHARDRTEEAALRCVVYIYWCILYRVHST